MRRFVSILAAFMALAATSDVRFNSEQYSFVPKAPVFVLEVEGRDGAKFRFCHGIFLNKTTGIRESSVAIPEDVADCNKVETFGVGENAYIASGVIEGLKELGPPPGNDSEKVTIEGKEWILASDPKVIFRSVGKNAKGQHQYQHVCRLILRPLTQLHEESAPEKYIFCKPIEPIRAQKRDAQNNLRFRPDGSPWMSDTMVCPLPEKCMQPDWMIKPVLRIMPDEDNSTAHAGFGRGDGVVHSKP